MNQQDPTLPAPSPNPGEPPPAAPDAGAPGTARRLPWRWLWWLALPACTWVGVQLLVRPADGAPMQGLMVASAYGLVLLIVQPVLLGLVLRRLDDDGRPWPQQLLRALAWLVTFALVATMTLALIWTGPGFDSGLGFRSTIWWLGWGACWVGLWFGLRAVQVPGVASQAVIALAATAFATNIFWADHRLRVVEGDPQEEMSDAIDRTVWASGLYGWLGSVLEQQIFRQGRLYMNPDGDALSVIGDHTSTSVDWPSATGAALLWGLAGLAAAGIGWLLRLLASVAASRFRRNHPAPDDPESR